MKRILRTMAEQQKKTPSIEPSHDKPSFAEQHIWRMRWLALVAFVIIFLCSLVIIAVTGNVVFAPVPAALLIAMRPIIRFTFPDEKQNDSRNRDT
jgi:hypothetical protein